MTVGGREPVETELHDRAEIPRDAQLVLVVVTPAGVEEHALPWPAETLIGRAPPANVCIDDPTVSRAHARLSAGPEGPLLQDLGSRNGTFVNNDRIGSEGRPIAAGDALLFGSVAAQIVHRSKQPGQARLLVAEEFDARLAVEIERSRSLARPLALVTVELGAAPGGALEAVRRTIRGSLRATDLVTVRGPGRVDVLLAETGKPDAVEIAARVRHELAATHREARLGVAVLPDDAASAEGLLAVAQRAAQGAASPGPAEERATTRRVGEREIVVADAAMVQVLRSAERVAGLAMPVLVMGETGSGKEIVSEAVHALGPRAAMPLVKLNCAAVPENLLESELFGFERGAFSGAVAAKPGRIEQADGGTLFLDEIGEMPLPLQAKILRVVEDKRVQRLGASKDRAINVRFVAATHRDLQSAVEAGRFRQDLYYRLATLQIRIPPLRERPREIVLLAQRIAAEAAAAAGRDVPAFTDAALRALVAYSWPGNIRELRNVVSQAVVFCEDAVLDVAHLGPVAAAEDAQRAPASHPGTWPGSTPEPSSRPGSAPASGRPLDEELRTVERARIVGALEACGGNQTKAAELLRMPRRTLVSRMAALGIPGRRQGK